MLTHPSRQPQRVATMSDETYLQFMNITNVDDPQTAQQYMDMSGNNLDVAVSLYFENGASATAPQTATNSNVVTSEDNVRAPIKPMRDTLTEVMRFPVSGGNIGGSYHSLANHNSNIDIFDNSRPTGIFNQQMDIEEYSSNDDGDSDDSQLSMENESEYEYVEEPVIEIDDDGKVNEFVKLIKKPKIFSKEERLARLFKPPFDIMSKLNLPSAKLKAQKKKRWLLINIQDNGIFQCQALNRDLWSNMSVKRLIKKNFIFLQYQYESQTAETYIQNYQLFDKNVLPHIAILDPITGERLKQWNMQVPEVVSFINEVENFLAEFSLEPNANNPLVKQPTPELDPTTLTEEQQMEFAIRQSLDVKDGNNQTTATTQLSSNTAVESPRQEQDIFMDDIKEQQEPTKNDDEKEEDDEDDEAIFKSISPVKHEEPPNKPGITTRIQIRRADGSRIVRRFNLQDTVQTIFEVIKTEVDGYETQFFTLMDPTRHNLLEKLHETVEDAGLKNSSIHLEVL